jgi:uroporphyrin-III C-methyltransferase
LANPAIIVIGEVVQHRQQILDIQKAYQEKGKELFEKV